MENGLKIFRQVLQFGGGFIVAKGAADAAVVEMAVGGIVSLATAVWMYLANRK